MNNEERILEILVGIQGDVTTLKEDVTTLNGQMAEANSRLTKVENGLIIIENDHGKKLGALSDGHTLLLEISNEIREDVRNLKERGDKHDLEIIGLKHKYAR